MIRGNANQLATLAYLATLVAIVLLAAFGALVCVLGNYGSEANIAKVIGALAFIGSAIAGLTGVIGTFRPKGDPAATTETGDVNLKG